MKTLISLILLPFLFVACTQTKHPQEPTAKQVSSSAVVPQITFIELGSVSCVPCQQMQPILKSIETKYGDQIHVVFYDVWKQPEISRQYGIQLIPTQIFLDQNQKELMRHQGFFSEQEIDQFLHKQGLKPNREG